MTRPSFAIELEHSNSSAGHCDCCGTATRRIHGYAYADGAACATYYVGWTLGKPEHGAVFDLILGAWGEGTTKGDRYVVALDFQVVDGKPQFMVVEAANRLPGLIPSPPRGSRDPM